MPRTFVAVECHLTSIFDLTDGALRRSLGVSKRRLLDCDWRAEMRASRVPITQELGRAVYLAGLEAMLVPSAADRDGQNLVVFIDNLKSGNSFNVLSPGKLPKA
jgi:RES domain-containing protein